ncbi:MAG: M23 family metallopeptidase [Verrucomicrobiota bacterium]
MLTASGQIPGPIVWPTPNNAFMRGEDVSKFIQPTVSGRVSSGLYGCVRNDGNRFHEAVDLFPIFRKPNGEPDEPVYAVMKGVVVYANGVASRSSYGCYVVVEHPEADVPVYTLYSHLASVAEGISAGTAVEAGRVLGQLGRSASYDIPKERAHLHFEIGLRISDDFNTWYSEQDYKDPNYFGLWNGMNLSGMDPLSFYLSIRGGSFESFKKHITAQAVGSKIRIFTDKVPDFATRYPMLLGRELSLDRGIVAWDVAFTQYGMPIGMTPWYRGELEPSTAGAIELIQIDEALVQKTACWRTLVKKGSGYEVGRFLQRYLKLMFAY